MLRSAVATRPYMYPTPWEMVGKASWWQDEPQHPPLLLTTGARRMQNESKLRGRVSLVAHAKCVRDRPPFAAVSRFNSCGCTPRRRIVAILTRSPLCLKPAKTNKRSEAMLAVPLFVSSLVVGVGVC